MILTNTGSRIKNKKKSPTSVNRITSPPMMSPPTVTRRTTTYHNWRTPMGRFFGRPGDCTILDDTSNTGIALFLSATIISTCDGFARHDNGLTGDKSGPYAPLLTTKSYTRALVLLNNDCQV